MGEQGFKGEIGPPGPIGLAGLGKFENYFLII
jgi:hypothetical protein